MSDRTCAVCDHLLISVTLGMPHCSEQYHFPLMVDLDETCSYFAPRPDVGESIPDAVKPGPAGQGGPQKGGPGESAPDRPLS